MTVSSNEQPPDVADRAQEDLAAVAREHPLWDPPAEQLTGLDGISEEFPLWHAWLGVVPLYYARRPRSSPPMVVRSPTLDGLREEIKRAEEGRRQR